MSRPKPKDEKGKLEKWTPIQHPEFETLGEAQGYLKGQVEGGDFAADAEYGIFVEVQTIQFTATTTFLMDVAPGTPLPDPFGAEPVQDPTSTPEDVANPAPKQKKKKGSKGGGK